MEAIEESGEDVRKLEPRFSIAERLAGAFGGIVVPIVCMGFIGLSESFPRCLEDTSKEKIVLSFYGLLPVIIFHIFSYVSLGTAIVSGRMRQALIVRLGIYTGMIWSIGRLVLICRLIKAGGSTVLLPIEGSSVLRCHLPWGGVVLLPIEGSSLPILLVILSTVLILWHIAKRLSKYETGTRYVLFIVVVIILALGVARLVSRPLFKAESGPMWLLPIGGLATLSIALILWHIVKKLFICKPEPRYVLSVIFVIILTLVVFWLLINIMMFWPVYSFAVYAWFSFRVFLGRRRRWWAWFLSLPAFGGLVAGYLFSLREGIESALRYYATLPAEQQGQCYIVTAAAKGHKQIVRSCEVLLPDGRSIQVNDQLRYLKACELVLQEAFPTFHRVLRVVYNVIGPLLAKCLFCPVLADIAYLTLKPAEWVCRLGLRLTLRAHARKSAMSVYNTGGN